MNFIKSLPLLFLPFFLQGQTAPQMNAAEIKLSLQKLAVTGSVLYIAAHPDDENTRLLTWLSKGRKVRAGYLSLTRGDGGQNLIGTEQTEELGLIRTQELLAARKIDGAEQFFARAIDFGYSKTAEETFSIWNKDLILSDVVRMIRTFRPDVIITRFPPDTRAGHGNHSASAILAIEAFAAAANPKQFPELGKPWQAKRILWNTYNFGTNNTTSADQLKIDVGGYNSLLGKSYGELAAQSRSQHKTQGFGSASQRGPELEYFALLAGKPAKTDLLDDIDISWNRVSNGKMIGELISKINSNFDMINPASSVPDLLKLRSLINQIDDGPLKNYKLKEVDDLIMSCAGIWFEMTSLDPEVSTADSIRIKIQAISLMPGALKMPVTISERRSGMPEKVLSEKLLTIQTKIGPGLLTQPYWLTFNRTQGAYNNGPEAMGRPESEPIKAQFLVRIGSHLLEISRNVLYKFADPVKGEVYQPLIISPPVIVSPVQKMLISGNNNSSRISVKVTAKKDLVKGSVRLQGSDPLIVLDAPKPFELKKKGDVTYIDFQVLPAKNSQSNTLSEIRVSADVDVKTYSYDESKISYDHLPVISYFPFADFKYLNADIKTSGKRIAYIPGAGDRIAESLKLVGYSVDVLTTDNLLTRDLSVYDAIIAGVRLYNVNADVSRFNSRIMEYVKNGGTYLVQYNVNNGLKINEMGPYPFKISNTRVTDESAHVRILSSGHPVLNYPNKITSEDFNNWVQERGLYFATAFGNSYQAILSMHDPGEQENNGALIVSDYGKGRFVYTSLSFFRQLPAGVPGAYRLFVNLIAKRKN